MSWRLSCVPREVEGVEELDATSNVYPSALEDQLVCVMAGVGVEGPADGKAIVREIRIAG